MNKITKEELMDYVAEVGEFSKEHRKYSSFWCWVNHTITQEDVDALSEDDIDASDFLGITVSMSGMWDDSYGTEWDDVEYTKNEPYQELVPEQVIEAHYVTKYKSEKFTPVWE